MELFVPLGQIAVETQIFTIWVPLAITLVLGFIGVLRGALRETVVAAAVVLGAFICTQWASPWASEIKGVFTSLDQQQTQFYLSLLVFWLIVLVLGYGLGGLLPMVAVNTPARLMGGLLGLMSGAAAAGWSLRFAITNPDMTLQPGPFVDDPFSRAFMIWAGWFPLALALLGTVAVIVGPLRRAQRAVAQPSPSSEWAPTAAASTAATSAAPGYGAPAAAAGAAMYAAGSSSQEPPRSSYGYGSTYPPPPPYSPDSPATTQLPVRPAPATDAQYVPSPPASARVSTDTGTYGDAATTTPSWMMPPEAAPATPAPAAEESSPSDENAQEKTTPEATTNPTGDSAEEPATDQPTCPNCGEPVVPGAAFCTQCGARLSAGTG